MSAPDTEKAANAYVDELQERIAVLMRDGPPMRRGIRGDGVVWMGTMRDCLEDYKQAAQVEARLRDEARAETKRAVLAERERCAKLCEGLVMALDHGGNAYRREASASACAAAIRASS